MKTAKIFLASSAELAEDRREFEQLISRRNTEWVKRGAFLELVHWENFLDSMSQSRLQDRYNAAIETCDIFVMLFFTKVGPYTKEEFETAFARFKASNKPHIYTYFKDTAINIGSTNRRDLMSLLQFQDTLESLGHFRTNYESIDQLKLHFSEQLDKLAANGSILFDADEGASVAATRSEVVAGPHAVVAQGTKAVALGAGAVFVGGENRGAINTGTQSNIPKR